MEHSVMLSMFSRFSPLFGKEFLLGFNFAYGPSEKYLLS